MYYNARAARSSSEGIQERTRSKKRKEKTTWELLSGQSKRRPGLACGTQSEPRLWRKGRVVCGAPRANYSSTPPSRATESLILAMRQWIAPYGQLQAVKLQHNLLLLVLFVGRVPLVPLPSTRFVNRCELSLTLLSPHRPTMARLMSADGQYSTL